MPKHILEHLIIEIERDIRISYQKGSTYRSVREIASHFHVSSQTAHRAVQQLVRTGVLATLPRKGTVVQETLSHTAKKVILLSNNPDPRANTAYLKGAEKVLLKENVETQLVLNVQRATNTLKFGEYLLSLKSNYVIAIGFRDAALGFYHAQQQGMHIVTNIDQKGPSLLPVVQTNNLEHVRSGASIINDWGRKNVLAATFDLPHTARFREFKNHFLKLVPHGQVQFAGLSEPKSVELIHRFFLVWNEDSAVFSLDYSANHVISPYFQMHRVSPDKHFIVYDTETDDFRLNERRVTSVGPSLEQIGSRLAQTLLHKFKTGQWPTPMVQKI